MSVMLVTGGSRGIGAATCRLAAAEGWQVVVNYTSNKAAADAVAVSYEELPVVAATDKALDPASPQVHDNAPNNLIYDWELGELAATDAGLGIQDFVSQ